MGICASKRNSTDAVSKSMSQEQAPAEQAVSTNNDAGQPQVFAIMRMGHEVIRDGVKELQSKLKSRDAEAAAKYWLDLSRWLDMHKLLEEGTGSNKTPKGFFRVLDDKFDKVATKEGLFDQHQALDKVEASMARASAKKNLAMMNGEVDLFAREMEDHLKKEEDVMMPKVQQMKKDGASSKKIMRNEVLALLWSKPDEEWDFFVTFACRTLAKRAMISPLRTFCQALWGVATPAEWKKWSVTIQKAVSEEAWNQMQTCFV